MYRDAEGDYNRIIQKETSSEGRSMETAFLKSQRFIVVLCNTSANEF